jgi:hypothetical protein
MRSARQPVYNASDMKGDFNLALRHGNGGWSQSRAR